MHTNGSDGQNITIDNLVKDTVRQRFVGLPSWIVVIQFFIGFGWMRAVAEKLIDGSWWTGRTIEAFALTHTDATLTWYRPFLEWVVLPGSPVIALVVLVGQLVAGLSLLTGRRLGLGLGVGMFLNLHFMAAGAVTPSVFYLLAQGAIALGLAERTLSAETTKRLEHTSVLACALAGLNLPFVSTLHPAHVIDDPAMIFVFGGILATLGCVLAAGPLTGQGADRDISMQMPGAQVEHV